jgi:predicted dehydrogenase
MVAPALANNLLLNVAVVASRNQRAAEGVAETVGGADICANFEDLLSREDVEAIYIATPPHLHREMTIAAIEAGKHVVCEKPFAMNARELAEISAAHRRRKDLKIASCSSRFLVSPSARKAREILSSRGLGEVLRARFNVAMPYLAPIAKLPAWRRDRATSGGGLLMDWGVYDLDWLQFILGDAFEPVSVLATTHCWGYENEGLETGFSAEILCRSGLHVTWERRSEQGPIFQRAEIRGTQGGMDLPFMPGDATKALTVYSFDRDGRLRTEITNDSVSGWDQILAYPVVDLARAITFDESVASPLQIQAMIHSVIDAAYASSSENLLVTIEPISGIDPGS